MSFGSLPSALLRLDIHTDSLQALEYFFVLTLPFSYQNNVRAASFVGIDRPPAGASVGNCIPLKKVLGVVVATIAIALSAQLMLGVALAIKLESRGPIIFRRKTIGLNGSIFEIWKFRSMYAKHPDPAAARETSKDDPGVTQVGRVIRRSSIDDLPRLVKVIQGRLSVVGPRAHARDTRVEGRLLEVRLEGYAARHRVKPGSSDRLRSPDCAADAIRLKS
jgi:polysaccharide biosynthesis protein PslA